MLPPIPPQKPQVEELKLSEVRHKTIIKACQTMKARNISYILSFCSFLGGFDFLGVNTYPIFVNYKTQKHYAINTKSTFVTISKQTINSKH